MLNRRDAFAGLSAGLVLATAVAVVPAFAVPSLDWTPSALTPTQAGTLDAACELIIPQSETPGARAAGVPPFVDRALRDWATPQRAALLREGLDRMEADAQAAHGAAFAALDAPRQSQLLDRYERELSTAPGPHFFALLKELTTIGYFTSEPGATLALRYDPVPGEYRGCVPFSEIGRAWAT